MPRAHLYEALADGTRRALLRALRDGSKTAGDLAAPFDLSKPTLSHHLKSLVTVGLVTQTREGTTLVCHANYDIMRELLGYMVEECCAEGSCAPVVLPKVA